MYWRIFLVSFLLLFLELTLIRFIPTHFRYVSFFSNIILLASFVGIGLGTIGWQKPGIPMKAFPWVMAGLVIFTHFFRYDLVINTDEVIFLHPGLGKLRHDPVILLPILFILIASVIQPPAKLLGKLMAPAPPLQAYTWNIIGSIAGVLAFALTSLTPVGPVLWFAVILVTAIVLSSPLTRHQLFLSVALVVGLLSWQSYLLIMPGKTPDLPYPTHTRWSPYYQITWQQIVTPEQEQPQAYYRVNVNNIGHQILVDPDSVSAETFYQYPYTLFPGRRFENVLVIGSGGGNDVAKALKQGAKRVVAVDIDPEIINLGKQFHPSNPYASSNVEVVIDDGRSYLNNTSEKFDLIILALTDSLTLSSANAQVRLESYLFTREAFHQISQHLKPDGLLVLYNYYRQSWLVDRLAGLLHVTFSQPPIAFVQQTPLGPAAVLIGSTTPLNLSADNIYKSQANIYLPTDNWPFLYLKQPGLPAFYWLYLFVILIVVIFLARLTLQGLPGHWQWRFFFLGAAFMLLETKNIVQFSLLFGSTWLINAMVFTGILTLVLLAILIAQRYPRLPLRLAYVGLFATLILSWFPQDWLLNLSFWTRLPVAIIINFSPVFFANLIFAKLFKDSPVAPMAFGANLLGAFLGGILEYSAMIWGYQALSLFIACFYLFSLFTFPKALAFKR